MNIPLYIFLGVLIFLLTCFAIFLFLKIRLEISYGKENDKKGNFHIVVTFLGGKIKKEIQIKEKMKESKKDAKEKAEDESEKLSFNQKIQKYQKIFEKMRYVWSKSRRKIRKNVFAEKISLDMTVGFEDAFLTGVTVGSLWALVYTMTGLVSDIIRIRVPKININPVYNENFFNVYGKCTLASSPANIMGIAFKVLVSYYVIKKKLDKETKKEKAADNYGNTN